MRLNITSDSAVSMRQSSIAGLRLTLLPVAFAILSLSASAIEVDATKSNSIFANATDVTPADRHVVFDFGVKTVHSDGQSRGPTTTLRVYLNYFTAKRLQKALKMSIDRHEGAFGPVVVDEPAKMSTPAEVGLRPAYANFVRLTGSPEELILEMGLNRTPVGVPKNPIPIRHTIVMDFVTGNTLLTQLTEEIEQFETDYGTIETDANKRVIKKP